MEQGLAPSTPRIDPVLQYLRARCISSDCQKATLSDPGAIVEPQVAAVSQVRPVGRANEMRGTYANGDTTSRPGARPSAVTGA